MDVKKMGKMVQSKPSGKIPDAKISLPRAIRTAYRAMHRYTNERLKPLRITTDQFVLLSHLHDEDAITQHELARRASSDANTVRLMLSLLEKGKLIERKKHPSDRRSKVIVLTTAGRNRFKLMRIEVDQIRGLMLSSLGPSQVKSLIANLETLITALASAKLK